MIYESLFAVALITGALGLWIVLSSLLGLPQQVWARLRRSPLAGLEPGSGGDDHAHNWPLPSRIARSFSRISRNAPSDEDLMIRLFQAGLPYYSPAHYYSRQVTGALLFAAIGLVNAAALSMALHLPAWSVIAAAFALGLWGASQPAAEVRAKIARRRRDLVLDMTYQLPRLVLLLQAYGSAQEAIGGYLATADRVDISEKERREAKKQARTLSAGFAIELGVAMNGMGGNLFAELLNRIAGELTRSVRPEQIADHMRTLYPPGMELNNFLDILAGGISAGLPMKERFSELAQQLRVDLRARQREAAQSANQIVILAAAAELLPIFAVVSAPVLYLAFQMFI
jgi:hypothetical protein